MTTHLVEVDPTALLQKLERPALTPAQEVELTTLINARLPLELVGENPATFHALTIATMAQAVGEIVGALPVDPVFRLLFARELVEHGGRVVGERIVAGGYPVVTETARGLISTAVLKRVDQLIAVEDLSRPAALDDIARTAALAVRVCLGEAVRTSIGIN